MNVTLPDDASIQIVIVPHGAAPMPLPYTSAAPVLLAEPRRKSSRRRDAVFLTAGAFMCAAVLGVVSSQHPTPRVIDPARAAVSTNPAGLASLPASEPGQGQRAEMATAAPPVDPTEAVRRLLDQRPTLTPPPGAPSPAAVVSAPGAPPGAAPAAASRNAFGMTD